MSRKSVQAGHCAYPDAYCAFEKTQCTDDLNFRSSRQMQGAPERAHGGVCLLQESIRAEPLGECGEGTCSPNAASCITLGGTASTLYNDIPFDGKKCLVEETKFGRCDDRCSWSPDDCDFGERWTFPSEECRCDKVRVGGCLKDDKVFCAVSPDACDDISTWLDPKKVDTDTNYKCFLCREVSSGASGESSGTDNGTGTGLGLGYGDGNGPGNGDGNGPGKGDGTGDGDCGLSTSNCNRQSSQAFLIVGTAGGVFLAFALLALAVVYFMRRPHRSKSFGDEQALEESPIEMVASSENGDAISML